MGKRIAFASGSGVALRAACRLPSFATRCWSRLPFDLRLAIVNWGGVDCARCSVDFCLTRARIEGPPCRLFLALEWVGHSMAQEKSSESKKNDGTVEAPKSVEVPKRGEVTVETTDTPPPSPHKKIHRRRPAPPVPDSSRQPKGD